MANLVFSVDIPAPPKEVFPFFVPQRMPLWYAADMDASFEVQGGASEFAVSQKVRIAGRVAGRDVTLTMVITAYAWEQLLEWRFQDSWGVRGLQRWELAAIPTGTRLTMRDSYEVPGAFGKFLDFIFTRYAVTHRDRSWLARLQKLATRT